MAFIGQFWPLKSLTLDSRNRSLDRRIVVPSELFNHGESRWDLVGITIEPSQSGDFNSPAEQTHQPNNQVLKAYLNPHW